MRGADRMGCAVKGDRGAEGECCTPAAVEAGGWWMRMGGSLRGLPETTGPLGTCLSEDNGL
jgi:hypothetical protein